MLMHSVEMNVGAAISRAPSTMACQTGRPSATLRSMFSITTVPLSTRIPTASAKPPSVIVFNDWPRTYMTRTAARIESGMDSRMMKVSRPFPRNSQIISAVSPAAIAPSDSTPSSAALTKMDWSKSVLTVMSCGSSA